MGRKDSMDTAVTAALATSAASLLGLVGTVLRNHTQIKTVREQTHTQIDTASKQISAQVETKIQELTQTQLKDLVAKRIEVYPELWSIAQTLSDLKREGTVPDKCVKLFSVVFSVVVTAALALPANAQLLAHKDLSLATALTIA